MALDGQKMFTSYNALRTCILEDGGEAVQAILLTILLANLRSVGRSLPLHFTYLSHGKRGP